ncbi:MAG: FmdE family protein [Planctomycetota bacterium]
MKEIIIIIGILFIVASFSGCVSDKFNKEITSLKGQGIKEIRPNVTGTYDDLKWQRCIELHGHECAGLAIGFRVAEAVIEKLHLTFSKDEKLVCVTEGNTCPVDAIQVVLSCSFGKGNLIYHDTGKMVFNFFNLTTGEKVRISRKASGQDNDSGKEQTKEEKQLSEEHVLKAPLDELFDFKQPTISASETMRLYVRKGKSIACEICGEKTREDKIRFQDKGKKVCPDCFKEYTRGW